MSIGVSQTAEWKVHWPLVLAAFMGISFSSMTLHTTGLAIEPLTHEFGWTRTQITAGLTISTILTVPLSPFVGALIDRWGPRRIALPGLVLSSLSIAAFGHANGSIVQWLALWTIHGLAVMLVNYTIWNTALSGVFTAGRSLAMGVALCGTAFAATVAPPATYWLIESYGWRQTYMLLAFGGFAPTFVASFLFLYGAHERRRSIAVSTIDERVIVPGLSVKEAARSVPLIRVGLATMITITLGSSLVIHKVPILTEAGVNRETAALLASLSGIAGIAGKLVTGWLMGKFDAGWVGGITNSVVAFALLLLLEPFRTPASIVLSMMVIGYAGGTKLQICAYLTSVYGGVRNYGKIYGVMASVIALAGGLGPVLGGIAYDLSGDYTALVMIAIPASIISGLLLIRLGAYPEWNRNLDPKREQRAILGA